MRTRQQEGVNRYVAETFVQEDALLAEIRTRGEQLHPGMQISPAEGKLLLVLAALAGASRILEIGTFVGYSTLWLARALPVGGEVVTLEHDEKHAALAEEFFARSEVAGRIRLRRGAALASLAEMPPGERVDLVFIDAAKQEYPEYLDRIEPMLRPGGLVIADNTLLFGWMAGEPRMNLPADTVEAMRRFNRRLADPARYRGILIPTEEGLTVAQKLGGTSINSLPP